jgi:fatty acid-binding protein DegV
MLNMKPILELRNGKIEAVERVRTMGKAVDRLIDLAENRIAKRTPVSLATLHANSYENAQLLLDRARERFHVSDVSETILTEVSPVIGTHTGPGALGLCFMAGM